MVVIVWLLDFQLHMHSVPITTNVVSFNSVHGEVYSIQHYVIKFVIDLQHVTGFLWVLRLPPPITLTLSRLGKTNDYKISICCFSAIKWNQDNVVLSEATCLPADCCFSELVLQKFYLACSSIIKQTF